MRRRLFLAAILPAFRLPGQEGRVSIRGKLIETPEGKPALLTPEGKTILLSGDAPTEGVLKDKRVIGMDFEAAGRLTAPGQLEIGPIHTKSIFSWKNGHRQYITYWCEVCAIRTYTPGKCWCCQEETELDIRDNYEQ